MPHRFLAELELPEISRARIEANVRLAEEIAGEVALAERELRSLFRGDDRLARLTRIPGIGFITAATVLSEVWDVFRFDTADRLCSWAGLTPSERSSAEHTRRGHISKQGSRWLRWVLVEAAARPQTRPRPQSLPRPDRRSPGNEDRSGGAGEKAPHALLLRPSGRARLSRLPRSVMEIHDVVEARSCPVMPSSGRPSI